jgi:branched-chain amino acid transport system substrate-binding protein
MSTTRTLTIIFALASIVIAPKFVSAAEQIVPRVSDKEIKIGNTMPYSGPASAYGIIGKTEAAYFNMLNEQGGINGRKINFISRDDGYSPPKAFEQVRQLVEQQNVLLLFSTLGTPTNTAIHQYLNENKVPLFPQEQTSGMTQSTFPGPWGGYRATAPRRTSMPAIS